MCLCVSGSCWVCLCLGPAKKAMCQLLVVQALRPDRLVAMTSVFVASVMGERFLQEPEQELDLNFIVDNEVGTHSMLSPICVMYAVLPLIVG